MRGARLLEWTQPAGERWLRLDLANEDGARALIVELFGPRGLWCTLDAEDRIVELSRLPQSAQRTLRPGVVYRPPPPRPEPAASPTPAAGAEARFTGTDGEALDAAIDRWFTVHDEHAEREGERLELQRALDRAERRNAHQCAGLERQLAEIEAADAVRQQADLLLAYGFGARAGRDVLEVEDPLEPTRTVRIPLRAGVPIPAQANALYRRAAKLEAARTTAEQRLAQARARHDALRAAATALAAAGDETDLAAVRAELQRLGVIPAALSAPTSRPAGGRGPRQRAAAMAGVREFRSAEGYPILVGKSNADNDRLCRQIARGNDLWLHVGGGRAGSHVVVRLPRGKTASLETLLDAGCLAVHFSKARGAPVCDVVYTRAKHVRKPKGAPPGQVVPNHTKTVSVRADAARLARLQNRDDDLG